MATVIDRKTVQIAWSTSEPADSAVDYNRRGFLPVTVSSPVCRVDHFVRLTGLQPNQLWRYVIRSETEEGRQAMASGSFSTGRCCAGVALCR